LSAPLKGALVTFLPGSRAPSIIGFPLNPETLTRTLTAAAGQSVETYAFTLTLDDALAGAGRTQDTIQALTALPAADPPVLFAWGSGSYVPVRVTALAITEQSFDAALNPVQAAISVTLLALTQAEIAALQGPMAGLAGAAYTRIVEAREQALQQAQNLADPEQSSAGPLL